MLFCFKGISYFRILKIKALNLIRIKITLNPTENDFTVPGNYVYPLGAALYSVFLRGSEEFTDLLHSKGCIAHKLRNIMSKLSMDAQDEIKNRLRAIYYAPDIETPEAFSPRFIRDYTGEYPSMTNRYKDDLGACLTHLKYPSGHRKHIRTTNTIERAFVEEKRRTKIILQRAHKKGAIGLVFWVLIRASNSWRKVSMKELDLVQLENLKILICPDDNDKNFISNSLAS